jgi:predicted DNA binding CopG/RHH family protein
LVERSIQHIFPYSCSCDRKTEIKKQAIEYTKGEISKVKITKNVLPHPFELMLKDDNVKVTLSLSRRSIDFFKREAKKQSVPYQKLIRALVDGYAERVGK